MLAYIIRRLIFIIPVLLVVGTVVFALVHLTPGDPAAVILGPEASTEQLQTLREQMGLNEPLPQQFVSWFAGVLRLDLGESYFLDIPVTQAILDRVQPTALLTLYALIIEIAIGLPAGVIAAVKRNSIIDRGIMLISISGAALPSFFLGILLILIFAVQLGWLPSGQYAKINEDPVDHFKHMIMPAFSLGFAGAGLLARLVRSSMLDVLGEDYVRTARAKGLNARDVVAHHALRNALMPAITLIGISVGSLLGGAVVTETVFTLPGMGSLVVQSVLRRDFPVVQGVVMVVAVVYVLTNLLVDVFYAVIDPRITYGNN